MTDPVLHSVPGVRLAAAGAGIRYKQRDDLLLIELAEGGTAAAVFTRNAFCAAPVTVARAHLAAGMPRYLLVNAGNANAGTGRNGLAAAEATCRITAAAAGCAVEQVLPFSTGVIGQDLPTAPFEAALPGLVQALAEDAWPRAARAIMTTDTVPKNASRQLQIDGHTVTITGICKGSGMIHPDMATMLAYVATDVSMPAAVARQALTAAVDPSFNSITVDGDTSTNDACVLLASGKSAVRIDDLSDASGQLFQQALDAVCAELARAIVKDGEGATKLVEIVVESAVSTAEARQVAFTIAHSPLVKTALFASDPNWGRILAAVGRAGVPDMDLEAIQIWLDDTRIVCDGGRDPAYTEAAGKAVLSKPEFRIRVAMARGDARASVLTCDLSFDYVKINAEYRS